MSTNNSKSLPKEVKSLLHELRKSLPEIQTIFLMPIAYGIAISEKYLKIASENRKAAKLYAEKVNKERYAAELKEKSNQIIQERKAKEEYKIAEEIRAEKRALRERQEKLKLTPRKIFHTSLAATSTIALVFGAIMLVPIARRSRNINECIKEISLKPQYKNVSKLEKVSLCNKGTN